MNAIALPSFDPGRLLPARLADDSLPWVPLGEGKAFRPLRFFRDNRGFVELLRLQPGVTIPLHRHTGEVHAFNLEGSRRICTGELVGPGEYVYEPAGNVDSWQVEGDTPLTVLVIVTGAVEYLDETGEVRARYDSDALYAAYRTHCARSGIAPVDLVD